MRVIIRASDDSEFRVRVADSLRISLCVTFFDGRSNEFSDARSFGEFLGPERLRVCLDHFGIGPFDFHFMASW